MMHANQVLRFMGASRGAPKLGDVPIYLNAKRPRREPHPGDMLIG
jgi:hypothetical protein